MSLSNSILVKYNERLNGGNTRAIYKLDDKIYTSDLTSVGAGTCTGLIVDAAEAQFFYNPVIGGLATIKACALYSDNQELDALTATDVPIWWLTMHTLTCSNRESIDINRPELHSGWGFTESSTDEEEENLPVIRRGNLVLGDQNKDYSSVIGGQPAVYSMVHLGNDPLDDGQAVTCTQIDWSRVLPFLRASSVLPAIPKLRLIHQYETDPRTYFNPQEIPAEDLELKALNPLLLANEVLGMELTADSYTTRFGRIRADTGMTLPEMGIAGGNTVSTKYTCTAFNGQYVDNLYIWTSPNEESAQAQGLPRLSTSAAMNKEKFQIMVNGFPLLPLDGVTQEAEKMLFMHRTKGNFNAPLECFLPLLATRDNNLVFDKSTSRYSGNMSFVGFHIGAVVDRLQIIYERTSIVEPAPAPDIPRPASNMPATLGLYAECVTEVTTPSNGNPTLVTVAY